ncbi:hypothetical protein CGSMWGv00703Bmash_01799 [Gardnerella pickettii 00703Bmash]|nr:DUF6591 domain-containing protein [Gardnerella pickettii]EIK83842.1 hypothetical protein CGSMWGv00703Bmash_01799 [Gardnerella pickettii 00703Bmash]EIK85606.1 hypothetical protein CGSMWGv00703C2mash_03524 [Gardnerella pickettii 00703C2mash]
MNFETHKIELLPTAAQTNSATPPPKSYTQNYASSAYPGNVAAYKKRKKPIYRRWWFYLLVIAAVISIGNIAMHRDKTINWDEMVLSAQLPKPPSDKGEVISNSADRLDVKIKNISAKQYNDYTVDCKKKKGFTVDAESDSSGYKAYNNKGYELDLNYYESSKELSISLNKPMEMSPIVWPSSKAASQLPVPKSTIGNFTSDSDNNLNVYVGNTSREDYNNYVKACTDRGFKVGYDNSKNRYSAKNDAGWHLSLSYEGNSVMNISLSAPDNNSGSNDNKKSINSKDSSNSAESNSAKPQQNDAKSANGLRSDFKAAMDSYESTMNEYVEFMKKYKANPSDAELISEYADYMQKYADTANKFQSWESNNLNNAELSYYLAVQARVTKKLAEVA